jgi:hypothetical protein
VLLVGTTASDHHDLDGLGRLLADGFRVVNYDRRGRGDSGDVQPYAPAREVEDLEALTGVVGGPVSLISGSAGCVLALDAASALGDRVASLYLYEPPFIVGPGRSPVPADYAERVGRLVAEGRRDQAVEVFMTEAIGMPAESLEPMRADPAWEKMTHYARGRRPAAAHPGHHAGPGWPLVIPLGMVWGSRRAPSAARLARLEEALSPVRRPGRWRGRPRPPGRATRTASSSPPSWRCRRPAQGQAGGQVPAATVADGVRPGGQPAPGAPQRLLAACLDWREPPLRAPAACWWARTTVESTWAAQSSFPAPSAWVRNAASMRTQVPPGRPGPDPEQDAVEDLAVVAPAPTPLGRHRRQQRRQQRPLLVGDLESPVHGRLLPHHLDPTQPHQRSEKHALALGRFAEEAEDLRQPAVGIDLADIDRRLASTSIGADQPPQEADDVVMQLDAAHHLEPGAGPACLHR